MTVNIRTLRASTKEILSAVSRGDTVFIANRGRACAKIVAVHAPGAGVNVSLAGMWKTNQKTASAHAFIRELRKPRHAH